MDLPKDKNDGNITVAAAEDLLVRGLNMLGFSPDGSQVDQCMIYLKEIGKWNGKVRLVSDPAPGTVVIRHILDSLSVREPLELLDIHALADVGSGGGFPGVPLAIMYPQLKVLLVERKTGKAVFLRSILSLLGIQEKVEVFEGDVRDVPEGYPLVLTRAFKPISKAYTLLKGLLPEEGGTLLFYGGTKRRIDEEIEILRKENNDLPKIQVTPLSVPYLEEERSAVLFDCGPRLR
ncbi:MAG: 16S rRNA (guanine(527)-N(7))-methyltransferase RsmG [Sediminispirochaetaceae bacterium]